MAHWVVMKHKTAYKALQHGLKTCFYVDAVLSLTPMGALPHAWRPTGSPVENRAWAKMGAKRRAPHTALRHPLRVSRCKCVSAAPQASVDGPHPRLQRRGGRSSRYS